MSETVGLNECRAHHGALVKAFRALRATAPAATPHAVSRADFLLRNALSLETEIVTKGLHDPCVGIRAVPVGEAMVACVLADHALRHRAQVG